MNFTTDDEIEAIARGLIDRTLPKSEWTHAAHWAAAVWMTAHPAYDAIAQMPGFIRAYNEATGGRNTDAEGYHETITLASLAAAADALSRRAPGQRVADVVNDILASPLGRADWLLAYWANETLFSAAARRRWVDPDIAPLPF